jgi:CBS domain-containing protein
MADVRVQDVMTHLVMMLHPTDTIHKAAQKLARNRISGAPVVEDGKVVGMISESDLVTAAMPSARREHGASILDFLTVAGQRRSHAHREAETVAEIMSPLVIQVSPGASVWAAASTMERRGVKRLPVVDEDDYLVGIISRADVVKALARDDTQIRDEVVEAIGILGLDAVGDLNVEVTEGMVTLTGRTDRKTTRDLAAKLAARTPGVLDVLDNATFDRDDTHIKIATDPEPDRRLNWRPQAAVNEGLR